MALLPENHDAGRIFQIVRGQTRNRIYGQSGPGGAVFYDRPHDLDHNAVWAAIDAYQVKDRTGCFEKVLNVFHHFLRERQRDEG